ncbi:MAG: mechanosensitive ion channel family protein [Lentisphaeria bacterium]|nr:mechanosensitive ion channel family protein [Lentisphaeria bacterium]
MDGQASDYATKVMEWLAVNGVNFLVNLVVFLLILLAGKVLIGWACAAMRKGLQRSSNVSEVLESFAVNVASKIMWVVVFMLALGKLGIDIGPLVAGLGVTGFVVGFAFQESLGNLAAGLMIALNQPFNVGDYVETSGVTGVVKQMNMMAVTLSTVDNKKVVVPNSKVWGSAITNYTALETRRVDLVVGISYGADIGKAKDCLLSALKASDLVLNDPEPMVEVLEMGDSSVNLVVRPWCKTSDYWPTYFAMSRAIKEALDDNDVEIPFPQMDVHHYGLSQADAPKS